MMEPCLIPSDTAPKKKSVTFATIVVQQSLAYCQNLRFIFLVSSFRTHLAQTFWNRSQSSMTAWEDAPVHRYLQNPGTDAFNIFLYTECGWVTWSFFISEFGDGFWKRLTIHTYFATVKHCCHIVLNISGGFLPLVHLRPIKIVLLNSALLSCTRKGERPR